MAKVFVTQYTKNLNFAEASNYGEVVFLTKEEYRPEPVVGGVNERVTAQILAGMSDYIPGTDFIITTGSAIPNVVVGVILARHLGRHNILKWNNRYDRYELFKIQIGV